MEGGERELSSSMQRDKKRRMISLVLFPNMIRLEKRESLLWFLHDFEVKVLILITVDFPLRLCGRETVMLPGHLASRHMNEESPMKTVGCPDDLQERTS